MEYTTILYYYTRGVVFLTHASGSEQRGGVTPSPFLTHAIQNFRRVEVEGV